MPAMLEKDSTETIMEEAEKKVIQYPPENGRRRLRPDPAGCPECDQ